ECTGTKDTVLGRVTLSHGEAGKRHDGAGIRRRTAGEGHAACHVCCLLPAGPGTCNLRPTVRRSWARRSGFEQSDVDSPADGRRRRAVMRSEWKRIKAKTPCSPTNH